MKKRLLTILTALTLLLTVAVMTSVAFATDSTTYDITNISYIDSFGVCNVTWSDTGDPGGYFVKAYSTDDTSSPIYTAMVTDAYIFVRLFATDGGTYYVTVTPVNGTTTVTSSTFTYDASKDATYPYVIYSASYDSESQRMSWNVYGSVYGFRVDAYEYGGTSPVYSAYTTSTYISASEIFPANGSYYFKIWIVDSSGNNISDSTAWICVRTGAYEYTGYTTATVIFDANGGFFNDNDDYTQYYAHADSSGTVTFPTNQFKMGQMLEGWYTAAEDGDLVTASTTFTSDTTLYAHWVTCDHAGSTGRSTCDLMATCSVCGNRIPYSHTMEHIDGVAPTCSEDGTLECYYCTSCGRYYSSADGYREELLDTITDPATGDHTYDENNKCTYCGTIGASEDDPYTDSSTGATASVLSVTATDNSTNSALSAVVNGSSVTSSTVTISRVGYKLEGTLSVSQVSTSTIANAGTITLSDISGSLSLSNATSSGTAISAGTTLSGTYTDTSSGDVTPMKGEVLFYGNISYSDESVIEKSTFSISLTPTSTLDLDSLSLLHYDTTSSAWEQLAISSATKDTSGAVTLTFQTSSLSPFMVLTTGVNYGTVTVGGVQLEDGEYLITGSSTVYTGNPELDATATNVGYAYYKSGILYLCNYTLSTTSDGISAEKSLTIVVNEDNYITVNGANGICADDDLTFTSGGNLTLTVENDGTVYGIKSEGDITIAEATIKVEATVTTGNDGSAYGIYADGDVTIYDGSTVTAEATNSSSSLSYSAWGIYAEGDITITDSSTASVTTYGYRVSCSIEATNGISITDGSTVEAESTVSSEYGRASAIFANSDAVIISESEVTADVTSGAAGQAIMSYGSNVEISSSKVTATVSFTNGASSSYGIYAQADVIITGSDSEITSTVTAASDSSYAFPIYAINNISITGGSVDATATNSGTNGKAYGIYSRNGDTAISDSASIEATASSDNGDAFGIYAAVDVSISGGEVTATAESDGDSATASAIYSRAGEITIDDGSVVEANATGDNEVAYGIYTGSTAGTIEISGSEVDVTVEGNDAVAIYSSYSSLKISDGSVVTAIATSETGTTGSIAANGTIDISGSTVTATSTGIGNTVSTIASAGNMNISDGSVVTATAVGDTYAVALMSNGSLTVEDSTLTATATATDVVTIYAIHVNSNLIISVSTVEADGGIKVGSGNVTVTAGTSMLEVKAGAAAASATAKAYAQASGTLIIPNATWTSVWADYGYVEVAQHTHAYDSGEITTSPTCTETGVKTYTCGCGYTYTEPVAATGHNYEAAFTWADDLESATVVLTCSVCQDTVSNNLSVEITENNGVYTASVTYGDVTYTNSINTYTITWQNYNGETLETDTKVVEGSTPEYNSSTPTRASDDDYSYVFSGWSPAIAAVTGDTTYTATYTAVDHVWSEPEWTWNTDDYTATATFTCTDCGHTVTVNASVSSVYRLGQRIYTAELTFGGETYKTTQTTGTSLLMIQADYSSVTLAIARANGLDASSYSNFETVTAAIDAVQWGLNVLNQPLVTSYADAINAAIDSLVLADIVEETVEIDEPIEGTDTVTEPDDEPEEVTVNDTEPEANPTTGIMISLMAIATAAAAAGVSKKR